MALDDFAPSSPTPPQERRATSPEDEDLFDFPVIVMQASTPGSATPASQRPMVVGAQGLSPKIEISDADVDAGAQKQAARAAAAARPPAGTRVPGQAPASSAVGAEIADPAQAAKLAAELDLILPEPAQAAIAPQPPAPLPQQPVARAPVPPATPPAPPRPPVPPQPPRAPIAPPVAAQPPLAMAQPTPEPVVDAEPRHAPRARSNRGVHAALAAAASRAVPPTIAAASDVEAVVEEDATFDPETEPSVEIAPARRRRALVLPSTPALAAVSAILLANAIVFFASWKSNRDFRAGLESLRQELGYRGATPTQAAERAPIADPPETASARPHEPVAVDPVAPAPAPAPAPTTRASAEPPVPLETFERTALAIARQEIESGRFGAARQRLQRLLAVVDRVEASVRPDVEAEAAFLVADSYRAQAEARREEAR